MNSARLLLTRFDPALRAQGIGFEKEEESYTQMIYFSNQRNIEYSQNREGKGTDKTED